MPGPGSRWRHAARAAAAWATVAALAACSSGGKPDDPARPGGAVLPAGASAALGHGTLYLLLGDQPISANLWRVSLPDGRARQLTFNKRGYGVSNFSASPAGLVLGNARSGVDQTEIMRHGSPWLLGSGIGDSPQITSAGLIAAAASSEDGVRHGPWSHDRVLLWASPAAPYRTIYRARPDNLATVAWNPAGTQILLINGPNDNSHTRLFTASTQGQILRHIGTVPGVPNIYAWGRYGLAIGHFLHPGPSEILSPSGGTRAMLPGTWVPACWNPSGSALLVMSHNQRRIGLWRPGRPGRVQGLGSLPGQALQQCAWISHPAAGA